MNEQQVTEENIETIQYQLEYALSSLDIVYIKEKIREAKNLVDLMLED